MEQLITRLDTLLQDRFAGSRVVLERYVPDRISGFVISQEFDNMEPIDRQQMILELLRQRLSREEQTSISGIFAMTPWEWEAAREEPQPV